MKNSARINQSSQAASLLKACISQLDHEELWCLFLNQDNRLISIEMLTKGSLSFYALYPSPEQNSSATINIVNSTDNVILSGNIPSEQTVKLEDHAFKPDMDYAYMYAVTSGVNKGDNVPLAFNPLVTTLEFTLLASTAGTTKKLTSVKLSSTQATLAGNFSAELTSSLGTPGISNGSKAITITLPNGGVRLSKTEAYTVTFLTLPVEQTKLTFTLNFADGSKKTLALKNNGNWVTIPACKKTYIWNLAVPAPQVVVYPAVGVFTVNAEGKKVGFARANLKYTGNGDGTGTGTWSIMDNPWDIVETSSVAANYGHSETSTEVISLFGWGTSGNGDGTRSDPWRTDTDYQSYGPNGAYDLTGNNFKYDWGSNTITNLEGSNWRTPSRGEWEYIFNQRGSLVDHAFTYATVAGTVGLVIFPDGFDFSSSPFSFDFSHEKDASYSSNSIGSGWSALEAEGCVFLPAAGLRNDTDVLDVGYGDYWSSTADDTGNAYTMYFSDGNVDSYNGSYRYNGYSVRLVREIE